MTTSTPTTGFWLRVTPDGKSTVVWFTGLSEGLFTTFGDFDRYLDEDPEGTIYYPITRDILKAAAAMADAIGHEVWSSDLEEAYDAYRAAVEKAVNG